MRLYNRINNITGWIIFGIAWFVYTSTLESTASFWDCGEFISGAYKLEVVHPPGAPFFLLLGRIFTLFTSDPSKVAWSINFLSGLASAFGILFLFWIITSLAKKIIMREGEPTMTDIFAVMGAGAVGALACTFSDTYWFSAVEGEVYALSTMFITLVFWAMIKWESSTDERFRDKWLVLIAFFMGVSIGVHLMSLLAIPAMSLIYYFKKYNPTWRGAFIALIVGFGILMFIYVGIVSVMINIVAAFDLFFVNSLDLPFGSGAITFSVLLVASLIGGLIYAHRKHIPNLQTALFAVIMILIGFSTYLGVVIRATSITPIDMNKPSDIYRLQSYLNREQYGDRPLLYGPHFNAYPTEIIKKGKKYYKGEKKYIVIGDKVSYKFDDKDMMLFPRLGSWQDDRHAAAYRAMLGLDKDEDPSFGDNMRFFLNYQIGFMYFRYFMWNFSGRQDDIQGRFDNNNGNWISGINFIDNMRLGPQDNLPDYLKENKGRNKFYMIPFFIGLIGMFFHYKKDNYDFAVIMTLFLFTGLIEIIFFNSPPFEPRERDYTLVGSFVTFCIWIGLGTLAIYNFLKTKIPALPGLVLTLLVCFMAPGLMGFYGWDDHNRNGRYTALDFAINYLESCAPNAVLFTQGDNDTYPLWYAQEVEGIRTDVRVVNLSLLGVDWYIEQLKYKSNDADPVKLVHTPDKYLGNNRDVIRYFDNKKIPQDKSIELMNVLKFIASDDKSSQVQVSSGEFINYLPTKNLKITVDSAQVVKNKVVPPDLYNQVVKELNLKIDRNNLLKNDLIVLDIVASNLWERPIYFAVSVSPDSYLGLQKYFQLEGLAYRIVPVEDKSPGGGQNGYVSLDLMYGNVMNKFKWGGIEKKDTIQYHIQTGETKASIAEQFHISEFMLTVANPGKEEFNAGDEITVIYPHDIYLDENILRMTMNLRSNFARLAEALMVAGKRDSAEAVLDRCIAVMPNQTVPYNIFMIRFPEMYYQLGEKEKARDIIRALATIYEQEMEYNSDVYEKDPGAKRSMQQAYAVMQELLRITRANDKEMEEELAGRFANMQTMLQQIKPS